MKNLIKFTTVAAIAALSLAGCKKAEISEPSCNTKTVSFHAASLEAKTAFGTPSGTTYPTLWTENDENVAITLNMASPKNAEVTPSADFKTAGFNTEIEDDGSGSYVFKVVSPATALLGVSKDKGLNIDFPASQTPIAGSVDEAAQILFAESETFTAFPTKTVELEFSHLSAYGRLSIVNLAAGAAISSISLTGPSNWVGRWYYKDGAFTENSASATISINTTSASDIWFACAPVDFGGKTVKVTVTTDKGDYVKNITIPAGKKFESGKIAKFAVDFTGITPGADVVYTLVTSLDDLTVGSEVLIVANDYAKALSTTQNSNNRGAADVTKTGNTIKNPADGVQVLTLEKGTKAKTASFNTGSGYLYAASSGSNHLKTEEDKSDNSSFSVAISDGVATVVAQGSYTRNLMQYNTSGLFSCYASDKPQKAIGIYKKNGSGTAEKIFSEGTAKVTGVSLDVTELALAEGGSATLKATVAPADAANKKVSWSTTDASVATVADGVVTAVGSGTATITVTTEDGGFTATCAVTVTGVPTYASLAALVAAGKPSSEGITVKVTLTDEVITGFYTSGSYRNGVYFNAGGREVEIYCKNVPSEWEEGGKVSGTVTCPWKLYGDDTWELCPTNYDDFDYTAPVVTKYTVNIASMTHGSVTANPTEAAAGKTVTLTVTPDSGYALDQLTVVDASSNPVTVTSNTFTMPASDVTVSATFKENSGGEESVIYSTTFAYPISGSSYQSSTPISGKDSDGKEWQITYGNWNGSKQAEFRLYSSGGGYGVLEQKFDLPKVTKVVYKAKAATTNGAKLLLDTFYSTDGGTTWTQVDTAKAIDSSETEYSFTVSAAGTYSSVRIKFALSASSTKPSSKNAVFDITSCEIYGL